LTASTGRDSMSASAPIRVVISGASGRMGRTLARLAADHPGISIVGGIDREVPATPTADMPRILTIDTADRLLAEADVVVDFSAPAFLFDLLDAHSDAFAGTALVVGTTGLGTDVATLLERAAERTAVLTAANFSVGVNVLLALVERAASALGPSFDIEIVEAHHRRKVDAPSGTALALGEAAAAGRELELERARRDGRSGNAGPRAGGEMGFHAVRGGEVIGDHTVLFLGDMERVELVHRASNRELFAVGALRAATWIAGRPAGRYSMGDVLGL